MCWPFARSEGYALRLDFSCEGVVAKDLSHGLAKPMTSDIARLKKLAIYLKGTMEFGLTTRSRGSGWARASSSLVRAWSWTAAAASRPPPPSPARSSAEAAYYAMMTAPSGALHIAEMVKFLRGFEAKTMISSDASGARSIAARQGVG